MANPPKPKKNGVYTDIIVKIEETSGTVKTKPYISDTGSKREALADAFKESNTSGDNGTGSGGSGGSGGAGANPFPNAVNAVNGTANVSGEGWAVNAEGCDTLVWEGNYGYTYVLSMNEIKTMIQNEYGKATSFVCFNVEISKYQGQLLTFNIRCCDESGDLIGYVGGYWSEFSGLAPLQIATPES